MYDACERCMMRAKDVGCVRTMDLESQNEWISVSLYDRRGRFVGGGEGDGEREHEDERDDGDDDDECDDERGDDDGNDYDKSDEAYGVTSLESKNGEDDEKQCVNGRGDAGEKPAEYDDVDNGDGGDGLGDGNGVFWDECVREDVAECEERECDEADEAECDGADEAECDGEGVVESPEGIVLLLDAGLGSMGGSNGSTVHRALGRWTA